MSRFSIDLNGRTAIVTDAGIGGRIAQALAESGANVAISDLNPDRSFRVAEAIIAARGQALDWQADVTNRFQVAALIEATRDRFGSLDILVNAAGVFKTGSMLDLDEWDWRRMMDVNLTGMFFCSQLAGRVMADEGGGVIVNMTSSAEHSGPIPEGISFVTSQAGVIGLTRQCARELGPRGIRVNALCPANISRDSDPPDSPNNALQRYGSEGDIANAVLFLCSDAARFITGQAINVDGGESLV